MVNLIIAMKEDSDLICCFKISTILEIPMPYFAQEPNLFRSSQNARGRLLLDEDREIKDIRK